MPLAPDRADLYDLNDDDFAVKCVRELTDNQLFDMPVQAGHQASAWFNHFYFEARNLERVFEASLRDTDSNYDHWRTPVGLAARVPA